MLIVVSPPNFSVSLIANIALYSTKLAIAPDGRIFVSEKAGKIWVVKNGVKLSTPFLTLANVDSSAEHGVYQMVFDPSFASNNYVYVFYSTTLNGKHNRVSRFTASGDVAAASSEQILLEFPTLITAV